MKTFTCKELGGICESEIKGESPRQVLQNGYYHVVNQVNNGSDKHIQILNLMNNMIGTTQGNVWYKNFINQFEEKKEDEGL